MNKKFAEDYKVEIQEINGFKKRRLIYCGEYYNISEKNAAYKKRRIIYFLLLLLQILLYFWCGLLNNPGSRSFYVILPYLLPIMPLYYLSFGIITMPKWGKEIEKVKLEHTFFRIFRSLIGLIIIYSGLLISDTIYIINNYINFTNNKEYVFLTCCSINLIQCIAFINIHYKFLKKEKYA